MSAILGVSINGDDVRMALADAPMSGDPAVYGGRAVRKRSVEMLDAARLLNDVPSYGTPEEQVAYALRPLLAGRAGEGAAASRIDRTIRSVVFAYHDADQAKRITMGTDAAGLTHYSLMPTPVAALAELMATRQVGFARHVAVCNVDSWRYSCGIVDADGAMVEEIQRISTDKLAAADVDVLEGVAMVVDAAQQLSGVMADLVVLVGERIHEQFDAEVVERELGLPVIIPGGPESVVARGASLLPSREAVGASGSASDGDWAPVAERSRRGPDWTSSAAAVAGIVGLVLLAGLAVGAVAASGVLAGDDTASGPQTSQLPTSPAAPSPASTTKAPEVPSPRPVTTEAPAPPPPVTQQAPAPPPPPPAPEPPPPPVTEQEPPAPPPVQQAPQPPVQQAPAPPPPLEINIPGLPPIEIPLPGA
ncbi:hypothetical protein [Tomitella fengzijianii]|uniref:Uncharacterized protein n=1 Tax=Tomitella fengzijianii TaxID=2597660 RepID=A0A516X620_9ACTN|nr:hypothetical protein [Tomitella fengzijianii]QDQ98473.1 hypothetical protein FO059_15525 [Tomitella fengzijianii]